MRSLARSNPGTGSPASPYPGTFLLAFREATATMNWKIQRWSGQAVDCTDDQGREHVVGLENVFRRLRREDRERWPALIVEFLGTVASADAENLLPSDLEGVADRLLVRLGPPFPSHGGEAQVWSKTIPDTGLYINFVVDYPTRMCYVSEKLVNESARTAEAWLEKAVDNLLKRTPADCLQLLDAETGIRMCAVGDAYDSSRALILDQLLPENSDDGFFIALPNRDQLLVLPVTKAGIASMPLVKIVADKNYRTAPYPISDQVYWVRAGQWHAFGIEIRGREVNVTPPPQFREVLEKLGETGPPST
jgi:hypothetical protein